MRLTIYGSFLIVCIALIQTSLADTKNHKKPKDDDNSVERPSKYKENKKYKTKLKTDDYGNDEGYRITKYRHNKQRDDSDSANDKIYSKHTKTADKFIVAEEEAPSKKDKNNYKKEKVGSRRKYERSKPMTEEDSDEDITLKKEKIEKYNKGYKKHTHARKADDEDEDDGDASTRSKKYSNKKIKDYDEDSSEEGSKDAPDDVTNKKGTGNISEEVTEEEETPQKKFRRKIRVRIPDSSEEDSDESDERRGKRGRDTCQKKGKEGKRGQRGCPDEEGTNGGDETGAETVTNKRIRYSIKFAHEKEKNTPPEEDNIMLKIHRGDKKKYRFEDDDDDSSEEQTHPKRLHFLDDDDY